MGSRLFRPVLGVLAVLAFTIFSPMGNSFASSKIAIVSYTDSVKNSPTSKSNMEGNIKAVSGYLTSANQLTLDVTFYKIPTSSYYMFISWC